MCGEWLHTRAISCMHDFKDYIIIGRDEVGAMWKEKGIIWHGGMITRIHTQIYGVDTRTHKICVSS